MNIVLATVLGVAMTVCGSEAWDDKYITATQTIAEADNSSARAVAEQLRGLRNIFETKRDYGEVRKLIAQLKAPIRSQVRIETGSLGATIYKVMWVVENEERVLLVSNLQGKLSVQELTRPQWGKLHETIVTATAWDAPSAADYAMADGTAYFASICVPQGSGQFVIYAPVLGKTETIQERLEFGERTQRQANVLRTVLALAQNLP